MNKETFINIIMAVIVLVAFGILLPLIGWFAIIALVVFILFVVKTLLDSRVIKAEMKNNPDKYFEKKAGK